MWTEQEAFDYLKKSLTFGIRLGLERMNRLMELLGHPEKNLRCIHVAGTNGKGSVTTFCASILAASGLRVGVFTSPYLLRFHERIRIRHRISRACCFVSVKPSARCWPKAQSSRPNSN